MANISERTIEVTRNPLEFIDKKDIEFIWGSDIECYPNFFYVAFEDYRTGEKVDFEISTRKNQLIDFFRFYSQKLLKNIVIYMNGKHYDEVVIAKLLDLYQKGVVDAVTICSELYTLSRNIIEVWKDEPHWKIPEIKDLKRPFWMLIDPMLHWTRHLRKEKKISLKALGIQLKYPVVQELPYDPHIELTPNQMDDVILYCKIHDLNILKVLVDAKKKDFVDRWEVSRRLKKNLMNANSAGLIKAELEQRLVQILGSKSFTYQKTEYPNGIKLKSIIDPKITIQRLRPGNERYMKKLGDIQANCNVYEDLKDVYDYFLGSHIHSTGDLRVGANIKNPDGSHLHCIFASGGAHGLVDDTIIKPKEDEVLEDLDIGSMYPTLIINYDAFPKHIGTVIKPIYIDYRDQRLKAKDDLKKGIDVEKNQFISDWYKLILNTFYGLLLESYGWLYDLAAGLTVTINGQLCIVELVQDLISNGVNVVYVNTKYVGVVKPL